MDGLGSMNSSRLTGVFVTALGPLTIFVLIPFGIVSPSDVDILALAPEFWPLLIASVFTLMGILLTILPDKTEDESLIDRNFLKRRVPRLAAILAVLLAFYFVVPVAGMVLPAMILIFGLSWFAGERRWKLLILLSSIVPILLVLFFVLVANIPIPLGIFEFIYI